MSYGPVLSAGVLANLTDSLAGQLDTQLDAVLYRIETITRPLPKTRWWHWLGIRRGPSTYESTQTVMENIRKPLKLIAREPGLLKFSSITWHQGELEGGLYTSMSAVSCRTGEELWSVPLVPPKLVRADEILTLRDINISLGVR